jgi:CheY-like chemotaxis protein
MVEKRSGSRSGAGATEKAPKPDRLDKIGKVVGDIAHDFNNLLLAIMAADHLLLDRLGEGDPRRRYALDIQRACERAAGLTRQLLAFSRKQVLRPTVLNLNGVVQDSLPILERITGPSIQVQTDLAPSRFRVRVDRRRMEHVIQELVSNARDAMPDGGTITLSTRDIDLEKDVSDEVVAELTGGLYACLSVRDTGVGMESEEISGLFEPYYTTKHEGDRAGTGLGLAEVYGIVKQSGGTLTVSSRPGEGATFNVYLPRTEDATPSAYEVSDPGRPLRGSETILIVDDESIVHELCHEILSEYGYTILHAHNGREALAVIEKHQGELHLLITDVVMPGMNGKQLAKNVRRERPDLRVLFVSGYAARQGKGPKVPDPRVGFLAKPFAPIELAAKVRDVLEAR